MAVDLIAKAADVSVMRISDNGIVEELNALVCPEAITESELADNFWRALPNQAERIAAALVNSNLSKVLCCDAILQATL